jgi:ABC-type transport system involved in multi-copper enzyme maturation permease subunit
MSPVWVIVRYALQESLRRRVVAVVVLLTALFLGLYGWGASEAFKDVDQFVGQNEFGVEADVLAGATLFGLSMFAILFLGTVLAVFLTLGVVRGDAERGLLQPLLVRPISRTTLLAARFVGAAAACTGYVLFVYFSAMLITRATGGWWPDRVVSPGLELAGAVCLIAAISLLGSVFLTSTANGIAVFMVVGAGLVAGLLGQVGEAIQSTTLESISTYTTWALPFEALYQDALSAITADTRGVTRVLVELGPFGGAQEAGVLLWLWAVAYLGLIGLAAAAGFVRRDL